MESQGVDLPALGRRSSACSAPPHPPTACNRAACRARKLTDEQRSAIANYFAVYKGQERGVAKLALALDDHPAIARAYALLQKAFVQVRQHGEDDRPRGWLTGVTLDLLQQTPGVSWACLASLWCIAPHNRLKMTHSHLRPHSYHPPSTGVPCLQRILPEQQLLEDEQQAQAVLAYLPNDASEWQADAS